MRITNDKKKFVTIKILQNISNINSLESVETPFNSAATKSGKCKIYHQLLDICRDMMKTVKKMYGSYMYERYLFAKEKDRFTRKLKRVTKQLEASGMFDKCT